jgi:hypothetical protein
VPKAGANTMPLSELFICWKPKQWRSMNGNIRRAVPPESLFELYVKGKKVINLYEYFPCEAACKLI